MRFIGNIEAKIDQKGRAFLPSVFRKELQMAGGECLVLRKDVFQHCLVLYPESVWNELSDSMRQRLNRWNPKEQLVYRQFMADAEVVTLDGNGRFLISKRSQEFAGINTDLTFIGMGDTIEVWAKENAQQPFIDQEEFGNALTEMMGGLL